MLIDYDTLIPIAVIIYAISLTVLKKKKDKIYLFFYSIFYVYVFFVIKYTLFPIILNDEMRSIIGQNVFRDSNFLPFANLKLSPPVYNWPRSNEKELTHPLANYPSD